MQKLHKCEDCDRLIPEDWIRCRKCYVKLLRDDVLFDGVPADVINEDIKRRTHDTPKGVKPSKLWQKIVCTGKQYAVRPCPFCGEKELLDITKRRKYVECGTCKAYGPDGASIEKAVKLWNKRQ